MRIEIYYKKTYTDGRAPHFAETLKFSVSSPITAVDIVDVYMVNGIEGFGEGDAKEIFADPVAQNVLIDYPAAGCSDMSGWCYLIEVSYKAGVTDPVALTAREAIEIGMEQALPGDSIVQTARQYLIHMQKTDGAEEKRLVKALHNPLIQQVRFLSIEEWESGKRLPAHYPHVVPASNIEVQKIDLRGLDGSALVKMSKERLLALTENEMRSVQKYYDDPEVKKLRRKRGLTDEATDVELEMIAQTWSEHCKHKIFQAHIRYRENGSEETISSLYKEYIKNTTEELSKKKNYLRSVFHDNSGVVRFDDDTLICFKVETHNSPSALDPYGGAITGIVGVNRDIMGTGKGARPIFNTNVLCFGMPDTPETDIPEGLLHPRRVMAGVHQGIIDGGNQSGIPVVGGAFLFDESFTGKPLVFCGTGGVLPAEINGEASWIKHINPGDLVVMTGGRIGKDGIHGATFSSLALDETSPTSAVQIGDPITQKKMLDFLLEARDRGLYNGITDNGAGGLSSSLGEMAQTPGGIKIELDKCPLKYQGLAPWEILVSESQERMSLSVPPANAAEFLELAKMRDVEATVIGTFTDSGNIEIFYNGKIVGLLSLDFLHDGLPVMELEAEWTAPLRKKTRPSTGEETVKTSAVYTDILFRLLSEPNIASKEELVRRYDHEVQAGSVMKPFIGQRKRWSFRRCGIQACVRLATRRDGNTWNLSEIQRYRYLSYGDVCGR